MTELIFLDGRSQQQAMYPFALTRAVVDMPVGLFTLREKWQALFPSGRALRSDSVFTIASDLFPSSEICKKIRSLSPGQSLFDARGSWMASACALDRMPIRANKTDTVWDGQAIRFSHPWELLDVLDQATQLDFSILTKGKRSARLPKHVRHTGKYPIFLEKDAHLSACYLNAEQGPIYIGASAEVQEGAMIRGPFLLGQRSIVKMGACIYGPVAIGMNCLIGGEVKRSLMFPFSNKAHHGYMGDSVIGSWCNWGAGTSNSNLKNTAGDIRVDVAGKKIAIGKKAGVLMGDHSRTAINASLNSGSIIGVSTQVDTGSLTQKKTPSFTWMDGKRYRLREALEHIEHWKQLKGQSLSVAEIEQLKSIYIKDK